MGKQNTYPFLPPKKSLKKCHKKIIQNTTTHKQFKKKKCLKNRKNFSKKKKTPQKLQTKEPCKKITKPSQAFHPVHLPSSLSPRSAGPEKGPAEDKRSQTSWAPWFPKQPSAPEAPAPNEAKGRRGSFSEVFVGGFQRFCRRFLRFCRLFVDNF